MEGRPDDTAELSDQAATGRIRAVRPKRTWAAAGAAVAVAAAGLASWQFGLFEGGGPGGASAVLAVTADDYDPLGDELEGPASVALATDGDPATSWATEKYAAANLGDIKPGVGLRIALPSSARVTNVRLTSSTPGGSIEILGPGDDVDGRPRIGQGILTSGSVDIPVTMDGTAREIIVWITQLPESGEGGDLPFQARIGEVEVSGVANS